MVQCCQLDWGAAVRPMAGESESGDRHLVLAIPQGWLLAVADGLGHGHEAAQASRLALEVLKEHPGEPLTQLLQRCHARLQGTRGVALSLAEIDRQEERLTWLGIGNVEGMLRHNGNGSWSARIPLRGGIVGYRLPALQPTALALQEGDVLILATDGIDEGFTDTSLPQGPAQDTAGRIIGHFGRADDDALVLVARWQRKEVPDNADRE